MKSLFKYVLIAVIAAVSWSCESRKIALEYPEDGSNRVKFAAEHLKSALEAKGYDVLDKAADGVELIRLSQAADSVGPKEGFTIKSADGVIDVIGNDGSGVIYGCRELVDRLETEGGLESLLATFTDAPEMVLRGACVGVEALSSPRPRGL